ncbi:hypothetical protein AN644_02075 [Candidatus Epulonipiscium fishelsonii]|nr:hypothetical protein AN644_02075 [Epulopiscium sp. SCG-C06WGA-EpuloA1]
MKFVEKVAKDVDTAIIDGLVELGATTSQVTIEILEKGSKGIFGFRVKQAKVRITLKQPKKEAKTAKKIEKNSYEKKSQEKSPKKLNQQPNIKAEPSKQQPNSKVVPLKQQPNSKVVPSKQQSNSKVEPLKQQANSKAEPLKQQPNIKVEPLKQQSTSKAEPLTQELQIQQPSIQPEVSAKESLKFLQNLLNLMNITATLEPKIEKGKIVININSEQPGLIIGKKGETLEALQYLTYLIANKNNDKFVKISLDIEHYRDRKEEALRRLAFNMAKKCAKLKKPLALEPMNAYDRRIVHEALQNDKFVTTESEGKDPYRKVVIKPKYD